MAFQFSVLNFPYFAFSCGSGHMFNLPWVEPNTGTINRRKGFVGSFVICIQYDSWKVLSLTRTLMYPRVSTRFHVEFHIMFWVKNSIMIQSTPYFKGQWLVLLTHLLNTTTGMPYEMLFVMLIGAIVFPFALGIQRLYKNEMTTHCSCSCIHLT